MTILPLPFTSGHAWLARLGPAGGVDGPRGAGGGRHAAQASLRKHARSIDSGVRPGSSGLTVAPYRALPLGRGTRLAGLPDMALLEVDLGAVAACRVCGWTAMPGTWLCLGCLDIQEWSRVNRAFCDLLHRATPPDPLSRDAIDAALAGDAP